MHPVDTISRTNLKGYGLLEELALNLRSSWNHSADTIWRQLDSELWELTHNPWAVLQATSTEKISSLLTDKKFSSLVHELSEARKEALGTSCWFHNNHSRSSLSCVVYFCMEFMLSEALPIYSGGLGNVAGDQLKAASDLGVPVIAIGLLYSQGYFRQFIDKNGEQQQLYPYNDPGQLPIKPLRTDDGEWLRLKIDFPGWSLWIRTWEVQVGRRKLYLLDTNDIANPPAHRGITSELYGGDNELRLKQELILGICGWRLLEALDIHPEICHMNEGHAAFAVLERARHCMLKTQQPFEVALAATRAGNLFTTHTAVAAGFDRFPPDLISKYLKNYAENQLKIPFEKLLALGQQQPSDDFNMAFLAIRGSGYVNGVSELHGVVSRHLFEGLFPRWPEAEIPVGYVTNGVHTPSWDSPLSDVLWTETCGKLCWSKKPEELEKGIRTVPDTALWLMRNQSRVCLIEYTRKRLARQLAARGASGEEIANANTFLDPNILTLGFARRFAGYKRPDLLLFDEERFLRILTSTQKPVQLILAGKAHPADDLGHALIKKWMSFINRPEVRPHVIFLSDYDMILTEQMVHGVDVWINTPRRPWEASGTSGMKVLVNGGLNLSELDGWWAEAYTPEVGWAIGDRKEHGDDPYWDEQDANTLYSILENQVIPEFYTRDANNIPVAWLSKMRESMARLTPQFSASRVVREYTEKFYLPAARAYYDRSENNAVLAEKIVEWKQALSANWSQLRFGELKITTSKERHIFEVQVYLGAIERETIKVELYSPNLTVPMTYKDLIANTSGGCIYTAEMPLADSVEDFTPRIIPNSSDISVPLEYAPILWLR